MNRCRHFLVAAVCLALSSGCVLATSPVDPAVLDAIATLDGDAWTKSGKPKVVALEAATGLDLSAGDRDRAWVAWQACEPVYRRADTLEASLAAATADVERLQASVRTCSDSSQRSAAGLADWRHRALAAERELTAATRAARASEKRARAAQAKTAELLADTPVCADARAAVRAEIDAWFGDVDAAARRLLACLAVGES